MEYIFTSIKSNPKHEHAKYAKILHEMSLEKIHRWTVKESRIYNKALQKHGKDYSKIWKYFPNYTYKHVRAYAMNLMIKLREDKNHPDSYLKEVLEKTHSNYWTPNEKATFIKMLKKYGKNYKLIKAAIPTKTQIQVHKFGYELYLKTNKNPKHRHSAFRKKLEPNYKKCFWTRKEIEMLLEGVKKYRDDWQAISNALKTKNKTQVREKVDYIFECIQSNPKHEHAKYAKILKQMSLDKIHRWTAKENSRYCKALQQHGKDYAKIWKYFPNMTYKQILQHPAPLLRKI